LFFLDYFATGKLDPDQGAAIVGGIAKGCSESGCALIGGETAEMPGMYRDGDYDLAGFAVGLPNAGNCSPRASGRKATFCSASPPPVFIPTAIPWFGGSSSSAGSITTPQPRSMPRAALARRCSSPTRIYVKSLLAAIRGTGAIQALAHITGGGFPENLPRVLPEGLAADIDLDAITGSGGVLMARQDRRSQRRKKCCEPSIAASA
jgi:phosphoribosylformylglycinamidine cyclo-ligase